MNNLVFFLRVDVHDCAYSIMVNGMKLRRDDKGNPFIVEFPINEYIISPKIDVELTLKPIGKEASLRDEASCTLSIVTTIDGIKNSRNIIFENKTPAILPNSPILNHSFTYQGELPKLNLALEGFKKLVDSDNLKKEIFSIYSKFYSSLVQKSIHDLLEMTINRDMDYARAYYVNYQLRVNDVKEVFLGYFNNPDLELLDLTFEGYFLKFYFEGRICCLEDIDGDPPLIYLYEKDDSVTLMPIYLGYDKSGKLEIIR